MSIFKTQSNPSETLQLFPLKVRAEKYSVLWNGFGSQVEIEFQQQQQKTIRNDDNQSTASSSYISIQFEKENDNQQQ